MGKKTLILITSIALAGAIFAGFGKGRGREMMNANQAAVINSFPHQEISPVEREALLKMREEEKLARDVYMTLYNKWGLRIFSNIARSEQRHMDSVKLLIDKYHIDDPVKSDVIGVFSNPELGKLYRDLTEKGLKSATDALMVGAIIEDLDIYDLETLLKKVDNSDIVFVFNNLKRGSENHMRAFTGFLKNYGITYKAQHISQERLNEIPSASHSRGRGRGNRRWKGR